MTKQRIAILGIIIIGIVLGRLLLKRMDTDYRQMERKYQVMYLTTDAHVRSVPAQSGEIMYAIYLSDSVMVTDHDTVWMELQSGGFLPAAVLTSARP